MRRVLSATLILILFVNLFGYFISFTAQRCKIRAEVRELLKREKMKSAKQFVFTPEEFSKLDTRESGREFCLNGDMYDVVFKKEVNGKVFLTAYFDHKETGLLTKFISFFKSGIDPAGKEQQHLLSFTLLEFVTANSAVCVFLNEKIFRLPVSRSSVLLQSYDKHSPPPELA